MIIGKLETHVLQDHRGVEGKQGGLGNYELQVKIPSTTFNGAHDKKAIVKQTIAAHLASAVEDTEVPPEHWRLTFNPIFAREFNWPEVMFFQ